MQFRDFLKNENFLDKTTLKDSEMVNLILKLINISRDRADINQEQVYAVKAIPSHEYKLGEKESAVLDGNLMGQIFHDELYETEPQKLESALTQICKHANKIGIEIKISEKVSENYNLKYHVQHQTKP